MLLVFLMASVVAITLYLEIPRIAMETQRDKEQTLIDRGEQYKRAIQLFSPRRPNATPAISRNWRASRISASCASATSTR